MASIELAGVTKRYGDSFVAIPELNLTIPDGSFTVLLGPSGCGKTTVLRMVAGLTPASEGMILIGGRDVSQLDPGERDVAMVFQNYAIYPHMSVEKNITFGLRNYGLSKTEIVRRVQHVLELVGLEEQRHRRPSELSGGQRQRVALARAISKRPDAFLMDEPLSNLDARLRAQMRTDLVDLHRQLATTTLFVTHDQVEAMSMADLIVVMKGGRIQQQGSPEQIYREPANTFVAAFVGDGSMNFLAMDDGGVFGFRPAAARLHASQEAVEDGSPQFVCTASVSSIELAGDDYNYSLDTERGRINAKSAARYGLGEAVTLTVDTERGHFFGEDGQRVVRPPGHATMGQVISVS